MWYEILPSFFVIMAGVGIPGWGLYHIHNLSLGNHFRRTLDDRWQRHLYQRDLRLTGNPYHVNGLECLPDDTEEAAPKKKSNSGQSELRTISQLNSQLSKHNHIRLLNNKHKQNKQDSIKNNSTIATATMNDCYVDITQEFFCVAFHNILYYTSIYPPSIFETRRKYSIVVYRCIHPEINEYIDLCLRSAGECLKAGQLSRIEFAITNNSYEPLAKFVFDFDKNFHQDTTDAYLIQTEQNLRAFCLKLSSINSKFNNLPDDCSFSIYLHTNESCAVAMAGNPELEDFPLIEVDSKQKESDKILPLRRFAVRNYNIDAYVEMSTKDELT